MTDIDRRRFLEIVGLAGAAGVGASFLSGCGAAATSGGGSSGSGVGTVKLAGVDPLSGPYAQPGIDTDKVSKLTVQQLGKAGGHPLEYVSLDTQGEVDQARRVVTDAMNSKGIKYFFGVASSSVGLAVSDVVHSGGGLFFTSVGADEVTGTNCNSSTFRWSVPTYGAIRETVIPLLKQDPSLKRWYAITPNYVFGQSLLKNAKEVLPQHGAELVGNSFHSLDETQFSSYISNAVAAKPDVLLLLNFSSQNTNTIKQAVSFGLKNKMTILSVWASGLDQFQAIGADTMDGLYFGCQYWHEIDTPENKKFVQLVQDKLGQPPNYPMATGYVEAKLIADGIERAKSDDPTKVAKALEGYQYDGLTGPEKIRSDNHQVEKQYYLLKGRSKADMKDKWDYVDIISSGKSFKPVGQTGCKLGE
jgi:branched-chain amino acid transport system substrate-binding protein